MGSTSSLFHFLHRTCSQWFVIAVTGIWFSLVLVVFISMASEPWIVTAWTVGLPSDQASRERCYKSRQALTTTTTAMSMSTVTGNSWRSWILHVGGSKRSHYEQEKQQQQVSIWTRPNEYNVSASIRQVQKQQRQQQQQQKKVFRLVTWNVLAPLYASPSKYPWTELHHLDWSYRQALLVKYLSQRRAHIVCLQEVQIDIWPALLDRINEAAAAVTAPLGDDSNITSSALTDNDNSTSSIYYVGILQNMTRHHPVACATLVRSDFATVVRTESRSRALITVLQVHDHNITSTTSTSNNNSTLADQTFATTTLHVANVHWDAGLDRDDTRSRQIQSLLKRLAHHVRQTQTQQQKQQQQQQQHISHQSNPQSTSTPPCVILAGDWNMLRSNRNFDLLSPPSSPLSLPSSSSPSLTGSTPLSSLSLSKKLPFAPLCSVYEVPQLQLTKQQRKRKRKRRRKRPIMTFCGGTVLDYVWISSQALTCQHVDVSTFDNDDNNSSRHRRFLSMLWPNERNPSDHLPVTVNLTINS